MVSTLNAVGIEPVLLKGAAHLADGIYPDPGVRIVGDVDLLVPAGSAPDALPSLLRSGFVAAAPTPLVSLPMHHLPRLCDRDTGVAVELHTEVVRRRESGLPGVDAYVCGPPPMVDAAIATLTALGVRENQIHYDKFTNTGSS